MDTTWVLVANGSEARLFEKADGRLKLIEQFIHPASRRHEADLTSDHASHHEAATGGQGQRVYGSYPESTEPKAFEIDRFARQLAGTLDDSRRHNAFERLVLVAPPRFHGMLNQHLSEGVAKRVSANVEKDYTKVAEAPLLASLQPHLR